jgi:hypothetical protein
MQHHEKIKLLVRRRFPKFQERVDRGVLGPELPSVKAYTAQLESLSAPELDARVIEEARKEAIEIEEAGQRADQIAFFNEPGAVANFQVWCKLASWSIDEATALFLKKSPEVVSWRSLQHFESSPFVMRYTRLRTQMFRANQDGKFKDRDRPELFIKWGIEVGIDVPEELAITPPIPAEVIPTKVRDSMLRLILGMAMKKYKFDPNKKMNSATKEIADDLAEYGLGLDEDTVRKYLKEARDLSSQNPK